MVEEHNKQLSSEAKERVRQYDELHLKDKLVENNWYINFKKYFFYVSIKILIV